MKRESQVELAILRKENSRLRDLASSLKIENQTARMFVRENKELRRRQEWLERRVNELEMELVANEQSA